MHYNYSRQELKAGRISAADETFLNDLDLALRDLTGQTAR